MTDFALLRKFAVWHCKEFLTTHCRPHDEYLLNPCGVVLMFYKIYELFHIFVAAYLYVIWTQT